MAIYIVQSRTGRRFRRSGTSFPADRWLTIDTDDYGDDAAAILAEPKLRALEIADALDNDLVDPKEIDEAGTLPAIDEESVLGAIGVDTALEPLEEDVAETATITERTVVKLSFYGQTMELSLDPSLVANSESVTATVEVAGEAIEVTLDDAGALSITNTGAVAP